MSIASSWRIISRKVKASPTLRAPFFPSSSAALESGRSRLHGGALNARTALRRRDGREIEAQGLRGGAERAQPARLAVDLIEKRVRLGDEVRIARRHRGLAPCPVSLAELQHAPALAVKLDLHAAAGAVEL